MSDGDDKKELNGLARSIDALFNEEGDAAAVSPSEAEESEAPPEASDPDGDPPATPVNPSVEERVEDPLGLDAPSGAAPDEMVWEEVEDEVKPAPSADPDALADAVEEFLSSDPLARDGQGHTVREIAMALREANQLDPLARAVERLALEAGDPPDEACLAMARALVSPGVASRLVAMLGATRDDERRADLIKVCHLVGHDMALAVADALSDTTDRFARRTFLDCMIGMGERAMPVVEEMAEDNRWFVVRNAVSILGEVGGDRAVELITATLAHTEAKVRKEALLALAKVGGEDAGMLVYGMLEDPDPDVRLAAAMAAGALKVERALRPLLNILENEDDADVVVAILHALGQLGDPGAVQLIEKRAVGSFFSRPPTDVRIAAYRALHNIGTPHAKEVLQNALEDKDPDVRGAVRQLLR